MNRNERCGEGPFRNQREVLSYVCQVCLNGSLLLLPRLGDNKPHYSGAQSAPLCRCVRGLKGEQVSECTGGFIRRFITAKGLENGYLGLGPLQTTEDIVWSSSSLDYNLG